MSVAYNWIAKAIESSTNQFHTDSCEVLIALYYAKYGHQESESELRIILQTKRLEILNIIN